jgi:N-acetylglucosaminyl-diphospho-decaprenol L-rhamnosyltransferase
MDLSIIIVNWNSSHYIRRCLKSVFSSIDKITYEIIVVDNASYDECEKIIKNEFPSVRFIQSTENLGFAGANNLGYNHSSGNVIFFLNPDTEIVDSAVNSMFSKLQSLKDAGIVGCRLLNSDLSVQLASIHKAITISRLIFTNEYLMLRYPKLKFWGIKPLFFYQGFPEEVNAVSGASIMIKREIFEKVGRFSKEYFMYVEDFDLCHKVRMAGYKVYHLGNAEIIHHSGKSTEFQRVKFTNVIMMQESVEKFIIMNKGRPYAFFYRSVAGIIAFLRYVLIKFFLLFTKEQGKKVRLEYGSKKWANIFLWAIGLRSSRV